jgi:hypothetical protein
MNLGGIREKLLRDIQKLQATPDHHAVALVHSASA